MELTLVGLQVEREFWADDYHRVGFAVCAQFTEHIKYGDITFQTFGLSKNWESSKSVEHMRTSGNPQIEKDFNIHTQMSDGWVGGGLSQARHIPRSTNVDKRAKEKMMTILYFSACGKDHICQCDCFRTVQRGHGESIQNLPRYLGTILIILYCYWGGGVPCEKLAAMTVTAPPPKYQVFLRRQLFSQYFSFLDSDCWVQHAEDQQRQCDNQALGYWWTTKVGVVDFFVCLICFCLFVCVFV